MVAIFFLLFVMVYTKPNLYQAFPTYYKQLGAQPQSNFLHNIKSQFHTQDEFGQYSYGYNDGLSSKIESKTADGITQGSYAYIDSNGIIQNVNYISDDINGYRISASNLPVDVAYQFPIQEEILPSNQPQIIVPSELISEAQTPIEIKEMENLEETSKNFTQNQTTTEIPTDVSVLSKALPTMPTILPTYSAYDPFSHYSLYQNNLETIPLDSLRIHKGAALSPVYSQFHSQDELGQYSYGYSGGLSSKVEMKTLDGVTRGGYSYVDANGILQYVNYIADPINGFRVQTTNFPVTNNIASVYYPEEYLLSKLSLVPHSQKMDEKK